MVASKITNFAQNLLFFAGGTSKTWALICAFSLSCEMVKIVKIHSKEIY